MNEDSVLIDLRNRLVGQLAWALRDLESLFQNAGGMVNGQSLFIGFDQKCGSNYAACIIHGPSMDINKYVAIPAVYRSLLTRFNGAKLYAIILFGLLEELSNRRRCLSLASANQYWINEYNGLPSKSFYFGCRTFTSKENIGYFLNEAGLVFSARKTGEILNRWPSIEEMLQDEWEISKQIEAEMRKRRYQSKQAS